MANATIQIGTLPVGSEYINANMIGPDGNPIKWTVIAIHDIEQPIPSVTLESESIYWGQQFAYNHWDTSDLRTWLNSTAVDKFLNKFTTDAQGQLLSHQSTIYYDSANLGSYTTTTDKVRVSNLGRATGDYFFTSISSYYARAVIDVRDTTLVYYSNGSYYDISGLPKPVITTYVPNNDMGFIFGPTNIDFKVSNPNNTTSLKVEITDKGSGYTYFVNNSAAYDVINTYQMSVDNFNHTLDHSSIIIKVTDGLGVTNTKELLYARSNLDGPYMNWADTDLGDQNNYLFLNSKAVTITDDNSPTISGTLFLDENILRGPMNIASGSAFDISIPVATWDSLSTGKHTLRMFATDNDDPLHPNFYNRYISFTKSPLSLLITSNQPPVIGKIKDPFNILYRASDSDATHKVNIVYKIDGTQIGAAQITPNSYTSYIIPQTTWNSLSLGDHILTINASDATVPSITAVASFAFTRTDSMIMVVSKPKVTTSQAKTIAVNTNVTTTALFNYKVRVCNNANDATPFWEDMTTEFLNKQTHSFTNTTKTATDWAVSVEISITKDTSQSKVTLNGFGYYLGL